MSDHFLQTLEAIKRDVSSLEEQLIERKKMANQIALMAKLPAVYAVVESRSSAFNATMNGDEYFGKAALTAIREVLESRKRSGAGPGTLNEIYEALVSGGYEFEAASETNAKNSLRVTLSKRSEVFTKLGNGKYGLNTWYDVKRKKKPKDDKKQEAPSSDDDDTEGIFAMDQEFRQDEVFDPETTSL